MGVNRYRLAANFERDSRAGNHWSRREADIADRGSGRHIWTDSGLPRSRCNGKNAQIAVMSGRRPVVEGRFEPVVSARGAVMSSACRCGRTTPDEWFSSGQFAQRMLSRPSSRSAPASAAEPRLLDHGPAASRRKARYQLQGSAPTVRRRSPGSMRRRAKR